MAFGELPSYVLDTATDDHAKGAAGYWVAAPVPGPRSNAAAEPTRVLALDYDDAPGGPDWDKLAAWPYFAHTTDSHAEAQPRWRVWVLLDRVYDGDEVAAARAAVEKRLPGAHLRAISQPVYVPTRGDAIEWVDHTEAGMPLNLADYTDEPAPVVVAWGPPASRRAPSAASTNALVTRWLSNPQGTNRLAGATGACLAEWGWTDDDIRGYVETWVGAADTKWRKHADDAVRAARRRRAGDRIVGFPTLAAELGTDFRPEAPDGGDVWVALDADADAGAADGWTYGDTIAAWEPPPVAWVCEGLCLAPGAPGVITGYGGTGKTSLVQALAIAVAAGTPLLGWPVRGGRVTHLDYEQGADLTQRRYIEQGLRELPVDAQQRLRFRAFPALRLTDQHAEKAIAAAASGQTLLIIDSLVAGCDFEDENAAAVRAPLDMLNRVSAATGAAVLVVHHSPKNRDNRRLSARGSSAITDAASVHISYERVEDNDPAAGARIELAKVRHLRPANTMHGVVIRQEPTGRLVVMEQTASEKPMNDRIVEHLRRHGAVASGNALIKALGGSRGVIQQTLRVLEAQGVIERFGTKNAGIQLVDSGAGRNSAE